MSRKASGSRLLWAGLATLAAAGGLIIALWPRAHSPAPEAAGVEAFTLPEEKTAFAGYAGSESCRECHAEEFTKWQHSHHGLAERKPSPELDGAAFTPAKTFTHGSQTSEARQDGAHYVMETPGFENRRGPWTVERVIGHDPLRQFMVAGTGGRLHALENAWDPHKNEWFNIYGQEDRKPGEWGHWTGRGMVWNQMCASCHNTRLRKNYDAASDSYRTSMVEMSVGCEACHGPSKDHVTWQQSHRGQPGDPTLKKLSRDQYLDTCGQCHARRSELTGDFVPGDSFWDHHHLTIVDQTDIYWPDGQVRDENYEFASFLSSRMHHAGVRCQDCHDMHSMKTLLPGNDLCIRCHTPSGYPNAPVIVPEAHSFHKADSTGNQCVNCHMPQTTYMQRHPRHDHGFTIPDPLLTKTLGIPNACNRCHTDKNATWAADAAAKWWGPKMERRTRQRAQTLAAASAGTNPNPVGLLALLSGDETPYWKASALQFLDRWLSERYVQEAVTAQTKHASPLVRTAAAQALGHALEAGQTQLRPALDSMLQDPARAVRHAAAWALRAQLDLKSPAGRDLTHYLQHNADQPTGQMQLGQFHWSRGDLAKARQHMETAVRWDPNSPPFHHDLAILHSTAGDTNAAIQSLLAASRLDPNEAQYHYELGLAWSEASQPEAAIHSLREAVRCQPGFSRAWYNLGLALNARGEREEALKALTQGEAANPGDASIPHAAATIFAQAGRRAEAIAAAQRALKAQPGHPEAGQLLMSLSR